jgi:type I restriction enzyme, S subunit
LNEHSLTLPFRELPLASANGINPFEFPEEEFELYSVPAHETGRPEIVKGKKIGSNKQIVSEVIVLLCKINSVVRLGNCIIRGEKNVKKLMS